VTDGCDTEIDEHNIREVLAGWWQILEESGWALPVLNFIKYSSNGTRQF